MNIKKINKVLIILMILITIAVSIFNYREDRVITYLFIIPTLLLPIIIKKFEIKLNDLDMLLYYLFLFIAQILGCVCDLYNIIWWYDVLVHCLSGFFTFYISLIVLKNMHMTNNTSIWFKILFGLCFSALVASLWEIGEYTGDIILKLDVQHVKDTGVSDTMQDIIVALIGSILSGIILFIKNNKK